MRKVNLLLGLMVALFFWGVDLELAYSGTYMRLQRAHPVCFGLQDGEDERDVEDRRDCEGMGGRYTPSDSKESVYVWGPSGPVECYSYPPGECCYSATECVTCDNGC